MADQSYETGEFPVEHFMCDECLQEKAKNVGYWPSPFGDFCIPCYNKLLKEAEIPKDDPIPMQFKKLEIHFELKKEEKTKTFEESIPGYQGYIDDEAAQ